MSNTMSPLSLLDTRGLLCPVPIILLTERIEAIEMGCQIKLLSDDPKIEKDIHLWSRSYKNEITSIQKSPAGYFEIIITKKERDYAET